MSEDPMADVISTAKKHTVKKFEIVEKYVEAWAQKLLNTEQCKALAFIDCMSNSGLYVDDKGIPIIGTPIRVANYISDIMPEYMSKQAWLCFNDNDLQKIQTLKRNVPRNTTNFEIAFRNIDANTLLREIAEKVSKHPNSHYLLLYDPYEASIDWCAIEPFLQGWGEVIINHMVHDSTRGIPAAKRASSIAKYEQTYDRSINELLSINGNRHEFESIITEKIRQLRERTGKKVYISSFPFFNSSNVVVYYLIHCTGNIAGFRLFKKTAWQVFGGKSSSKKTHGSENQLMFMFDESNTIQTKVDKDCYHIKDIASFVHNSFKGEISVPLKNVWSLLDSHPIFPSEGFRLEIKNAKTSVW